MFWSHKGIGLKAPHSNLPLAPVCWVQNNDQGQSKGLPRQSTTNSVLWHSRSMQNSGQIRPIDLTAIGVTTYLRNVYRRVDHVSFYVRLL